MTRMHCRCLFDITATGITGHFKSSRIPFLDRAGQSITSDSTWNRARNQQRNWETLTQLISLRTQVIDMTIPERIDNSWEFEFATETPDAYGTADNPISVLIDDARGVPMLVNLDNNEIMSAELVISGPEQNIWFTPISINS